MGDSQKLNFVFYECVLGSERARLGGICAGLTNVLLEKTVKSRALISPPKGSEEVNKKILRGKKGRIRICLLGK